MFDNIPEWVLFALGAAIVIGAWLYQFYVSPAEKRQQMLDEVAEARRKVVAGAVERLVDAAEQQFKDRPKSGQYKFEWVMKKLVERFPSDKWEDLEDMINAAVHRQNERKVAVQAAVSASQPPRQNGSHE